MGAFIDPVILELMDEIIPDPGCKALFAVLRHTQVDLLCAIIIIIIIMITTTIIIIVIMIII
jgi:hypothetical protein